MKGYILIGIRTYEDEQYGKIESGTNLYLSSVKSSLYYESKKYVDRYKYFYVETWSKGELIYSECFNFVGDKIIRSNDPDELADKMYLEILSQAYQDNAEADKRMAEELVGVSYEVDQIMDDEFSDKRREKALRNFPAPKPIRCMTEEERKSTAEKLRREDD